MSLSTYVPAGCGSRWRNYRTVIEEVARRVDVSGGGLQLASVNGSSGDRVNGLGYV